MNEKLRAIVAQTDMENMKRVCEFLKQNEYEITDTTQSGTELSKMILKHRPDVVITDAYLLDTDFSGVMDILEKNRYDNRAVFVVATTVKNGCLIESVLARGVDMFTLMPFDSELCDSKIRDIYLRKQRTLFSSNKNIEINDEFELMNYISRIMHTVGVPTSIRGYDYICDSIIMALKDRSILKAITKEMYPSVAKNNDTTPSRVERAIRHAVEVAWQRGDVDVLNDIFGYTVKSSKGKPTNGEFISMIAEKVRLDLKIS